jgi:hypothetical protein
LKDLKRKAERNEEERILSSPEGDQL